MKFTSVLISAAILLLGIGACAQEYPKVEVGGNYSYLRYAPSASYSKGHSLNGGGGSFVYNINEFLGLRMDLQGSTSSTTGFNISPNATFPLGLNGNVQGNLFTYLFGPQIKVRTHKVEPFGALLFGGAHSNVYGNAFNNLCHPISGASPCPTITKAPTSEAFAMQFGGGIDIPINKTVSFRPGEISYVLTRFSNGLTGTNNQNNLRYSVGIFFNFGQTHY